MPRAQNANLGIVTMRLRSDDIAYAKELAEKSTTPYQHIIRGWVADGAARAKAAAKRSRRG